MNILILYPFYNQRELMHNFATRLSEHGVYVDVLNIRCFRYEKYSSIIWPKLILLVIGFPFYSKFELLNKIVRRLLLWFLPKIFPLYDLIDFHAYYPSSYNRLMRSCVHNGIKFDITLWGSDLMRATDERKQLQKFGFDNCYRIKLTENLYDILQAIHGDIYDSKCRIVYFGNSDLPIIDSLSESDAKKIKHELYGNTDNKRILVLGYNAVSQQNHDKVIDALSVLNPEEKKSIHVVLPMTYGAQAGYITGIRNKIEQLSVSYTIIDQFLRTEQVAAIRKTADIVVNVQNTDALAGSLQDHLYCGNICIFGNWLNYSPYTNNGIYYIKTSMEDIAMHVKDVIHNYDEYHKRCIGNHDKIKSLVSWEANITKQASVYGE